ncbi:MAG: hypothetical protein ACRDDY_00970 [Clostridium sp.]|uniref:hypothetical protein n=1 Tax=Clostridium sp. TaxID=1506 RepID=UPI003EE6304B
MILSLLNSNGEVHNKSGLNWGYASANVCKEDAYIAVRKKHIRENLDFFKPIKYDNSIDVIWDNGVRMKCLFEGRQEVDGIVYGKQISSYGDKGELGRYLRKRLNVYNQKITINDLIEYGRTDIEVTKIGEKKYKFDFSI